MLGHGGLVVGRRVAVLAALALGSTGCAPDRPPMPGDRLPDTEMEVVDATGTTWASGDRLALSDLQGRPLLLDFWASWCPPCREQHRHVTEVAERYGERIAVVGILVDDVPANALRWLEEQGATYPTVREVEERLADAFWIPATGLPHMALLDPDGRLVWHQLGASAKGVPANVLAQLDSILLAHEGSSLP